MNFTKTKIPGVFIIEIAPMEDDRGFFGRGWCAREFKEMGITDAIAQINVGYSKKKGTLRGLHYQREPRAEVKTVQCTRGAVYDVAVDLRPGSPTYMQWVAAELSAENRRMLCVPEGCAQGYQTLTEDAQISYLTTRFYSPEHATGVRFDDPAFAIQWPLPIAAISEADRTWRAYRPEPAPEAALEPMKEW